MVSRGRKADDLRRRAPTRQPRRRILVVCEGEVTEPEYFSDFGHDVRNQLVHVEVTHAGVPMTVVERAIELRDLAAERAKRERDANLGYDDVWAVFDVDEHPKVDEAKEKAKAHGVDLAVSNPCFELWALLHFQDQRAHIERVPAASALRKFMPGYDKRLDYPAMKAGYGDARRRGAELDQDADRHDSPGRNPTTGVSRLTELIRLG